MVITPFILKESSYGTFAYMFHLLFNQIISSPMYKGDVSLTHKNTPVRDYLSVKIILYREIHDIWINKGMSCILDRT